MDEVIETTEPTTEPAMMLTPAERWGTCCPHDPMCDHSIYFDNDELTVWMRTPISDDQAAELAS